VSATATLAGGEKVAAITKVGVVTAPSARGAAAGGAMAGTFGLFRLCRGDDFRGMPRAAQSAGWRPRSLPGVK
jgi:cytochrome c5